MTETAQSLSHDLHKLARDLNAGLVLDKNLDLFVANASNCR